MKKAILFAGLFICATAQAQDVGIGTTSPAMKLHVSSLKDTALLLLENQTALATDTNVGVYFKIGSRYTGSIRTIGTSNVDARMGLFTYAVSDRNSLREALSIMDRGNVGINTLPNSTALLEVSTKTDLTKGFLVTGASNIMGSSVPNLGPGTRLMFYPGKASFRAGYVNNDSWDNANVGMGSVALGYSTMAKGDNSTAMGFSAQATAANSVAIGYLCEANGAQSVALGRGKAIGNYAFAVGDGAQASGSSAISMGTLCSAPGSNSFAAGAYSSAQGQWSVAMGSSVQAVGTASVAMGSSTRAEGINSFAMGNNSWGEAKLSSAFGDHSRAIWYSSTVVGMYNDDVGLVETTPSATTQLFVVGNGTGDFTRSNAFVVRRNGSATLAGTLTQNSDARLKKNINLIPTSLQRLLQLNGYRYQWRDAARGNDMQFGVLAQEVQQLFPELVTADAKGLLSVNYNGLVPVLINAVKEQQQTIESLEKRLTALEKFLK